ncbi:MAG: EamA family transporter [Pseudomonadota bacterium]
MGSTEWLMLIALSILWGGSFFFAEVAVRELPPLTIVTLRVGIAALALVGLAWITRRALPRAPAAWFALGVMGLLNNVIPFSLIVWGQTHIPSGLASILNATTPIFTLLVAGWLLVDERITAMKVVGAVVGFIGVAVMFSPSLDRGWPPHAVAQLAILGAAISYAFAGAFGRRFPRMGIDPMIAATGQLCASTVLLLPLCAAIERPWTLPMPSPQAIGSVIGLALLSTAIAYLLYFRILARAGATNLLLVTLLIPVSAIGLGVGLLDETLSVTDWLGLFAIGIGLLVIDGRLFRKRTGGVR